MLATINFDCERCGVADKIHDVGTDRGLATKARTLHAVAAQGRPYQSFGIGRVRSQRARADQLLRGQMPARGFRLVSHDEPPCLPPPPPPPPHPPPPPPAH